jgi:hypothetical protein
MVKIGSPLMSMSASGKIGERLVFSKRASGQQARFQKAQKDKITLPRSSKRFLYSLASITWKYLSQVQKDVYIALAKNEKMTGYNYFMSLALADPKTYLGLLAYYSLNENTGAYAYNDVKVTEKGTLKPTYPTNCPVRVDSFNKKNGNALQFNGSSHFVDCGNPIGGLVYTPKSFSILCFFNRSDNTTSEDHIFDLSTQHQFTVAGNPKRFWYGHSGSPASSTFSNTRISRFKWYSACVTHDVSATLTKIYINGLFDIQKLDTWYRDNNTEFNLDIGRYPNGSNYFNGKVDNCCVFNRVLSANEIKEIHSRCFSK